MSTLKNISIYTLFLLICVNTATGQSNPLADTYLSKADNFKKNQKPDSALLFYEKAAIEFRTIGNIEKFVQAYTQIGVILTRQDYYEKAATYLTAALNAGLSSLDSSNLTLATTYISLGVNYSAQGDYPNA